MATKPKPKKKPAPAKKPAAKKASPKGKAKPDAASDPKSPANLAKYDAETVQLTEAARKLADDAEEHYEELKAKASEAKKEFTAALKALRKMLWEREYYRGKPPPLKQQEIDFEKPVDAEVKPTATKGGKKAKAKTTAKTPQPLVKGNPPGSVNSWYPVDLWKQYPLERLTTLGLDPADVATLAAGSLKGGDTCPVVTVGDVETFQAVQPDGKPRKLTEVNGVDAKSAKRIVKAVTAFWNDWPTIADAFAVEKGFSRPLSEPEPTGTDDDDPATIPFGANGEYQEVIDRAAAT